MHDKIIPNTASKIRNVSCLGPNEINVGVEQPFEWWGPSPEAARKIARAKSKALVDKRTTVRKAVKKFIKDGITIGIGGFVNTRVPVSIVHEIIRQGAKDLTLSFQSNSICAELLAGAMVLYPDHLSLKRVELAWWGYEIIGIAPLLRHLASNAMIQLDDYTNYGMSARFKAAAMGLEFIPVRDHGGSDMEQLNRGIMIQSPFSAKNTYLVPACYPDVALLHVTAADIYGNCRIFGPLCTCPEIAMAAISSIVTAEQIISNESIRTYPNLTEIPYVAVDALIEQPFGAYPGVSYGHYWFDMEHIQMFRKASEEFRRSGNSDPLKKYYEQYIFSCKIFNDFLDQISEPALRKIKKRDGSQPIIVGE
jgi:glutaconate CoA-transferase subunit A